MAKMTGFKFFKGTKETFISSGKATANADAIVFITGNGDASKSCIFAQGTYFANIADLLAAINYVKGISVGGQSYNAAVGGGYVAFEASDPSTVAVNTSQSGVAIGLTSTFVDKVNNTATNLGSKGDAADKDGSAFARIANLAALVSDLTGGSTDSIEGQITAAINALRTEIVGTLGEGDSATLAAINDELDTIFVGMNNLDSRLESLRVNDKYLYDSIEGATPIVLTGADIKLGAATENYSTDITLDEAISSLDVRLSEEEEASVVTVTPTTDSNYAQVYTIKQGNKEVGKINIPKDKVVESGEIVVNPAGQSAGTYIKLVLQNVATPLYINVGDLVDVYTAQASAAQVQVAISDTNVISATIVAGSISATELAADAVVTAKIKDANVTKAKLESSVQTSLGKADTAYQKPSTGIAKSDLASAVQTSLGKADSAYQKPSTGIAKTDLASAVQTSLGKADAAAPQATTYTKAEVDAMWEWEEL
jgi:hypothetical protein